MGGDNVIVSAEVIKQSPLGTELNEEQCDQLSRVVSAVGLEQGSFLLEEGHKDDAIHIVTRGTLEVVKPTGGGDWVTLQVLRPGDMAGELGFIDGIEYQIQQHIVNVGKKPWVPRGHWPFPLSKLYCQPWGTFPIPPFCPKLSNHYY